MIDAHALLTNQRLDGSQYRWDIRFQCVALNRLNNPALAASLMRAASTNRVTSALELLPSRFSRSTSEIPVASMSEL